MPADKAEIGIAWGLMHFSVMMHYHVMYGIFVAVCINGIVPNFKLLTNKITSITVCIAIILPHLEIRIPGAHPKQSGKGMSSARTSGIRMFFITVYMALYLEKHTCLFFF